MDNGDAKHEDQPDSRPQKIASFLHSKFYNGYDKESSVWKLEHYNIKHKHLAKYYIFNHYEFNVKGEKLSPRNGTERDVEELGNVFQQLNCVPGDETYQDLELRQLRQKLSNISQDDYEDYSAVIIVVLSHGDEGIIYAHDYPYKLKDLWEPFISPKSSQTLVGKPKIFIVQACQGAVPDSGREIVHIDAAVVEPPEHTRIPAFSDFLFVFSSPPGYCAFRGANGSWMVQTLCEALRQFHDQLDLQSIIMLVKHNIAFQKTSNSNILDLHHKKQIPFEASTLTKKFYMTHTCLENHPNWTDEGKCVVTRSFDAQSKPEKSRKVSRDSSLRGVVTSAMKFRPVTEPTLAHVLNNRSTMITFGTILVVGIFAAVFLALFCAKIILN